MFEKSGPERIEGGAMGLPGKALAGTVAVAAVLALAGWTGPGSPERIERLLLLKDLQIGVLDAESTLNQFLLTYPVDGLLIGQAYVARLDEVLAGLSVTLREVDWTDDGGLPAPGDTGNAIAAELSEFDAHARRVVALAQARGDAGSGIVWEMHRMAEGLERYLVKLEAEVGDEGSDPARARAVQDLKVDLLRIRSWGKEYLLRDDLVFITSMLSRVADIERAIAHGPFADKERDRILTYLKTYLIYIERIALIDVRLRNRLNRMMESGERIRALLQEMVEREVMGLHQASR
jgi:hypothetical protein